MSIIQYLEDGRTGAQPLSNNLYTDLQEDILTGRRRPGEKLTEQKLCEAYKLSRTPVREALLQLETEGLIENIPNRGAFVLGISEQDIADLCTMQTFCEVQAVRWAVERITEEEQAELEETFAFMEFYTMKNDLNKMQNINAAFHQILYHATHNRRLERMLATTQTYLRHCRPVNLYAPNYLADVLDEHRRIYEAFQAGDAEGAAQSMTFHMEQTQGRRLR